MGIVSQRLRDSARGRDCTLRIPYTCNHNPETTVLAHLPDHTRGKGSKGNDWHAVFACHDCHTALDTFKLQPDQKDFYIIEALRKTQLWWFENGYLEIVGDKEPKPRPTSSKSLPPKLSWQKR